MADISDVTSYLVSAATAAVYPNGTVQPSVAAMDVRLFEGWPLPDQLDLDLNGKTLVNNVPVARTNGPLANISVFPMLGTTLASYQIQDNTKVISYPTFGLVVSIVGGVINVSGTPNSGEYLTVIADANAFSATGASAAAVISALAAFFATKYSGVSSTSSTLTIPYGRTLVVRQGGQGVLGKVTHRQRQSVMVTVWSPTHEVRSILSAAVDNAIKANFKVAMPDTSQILILYNRTNVIDDKQMTTLYRRDLVYDVEYATVLQFPGFVVTTVDVSVANFNSSLVAPAVI